MRERRPERVLVLGTRMGEPTSFWNPVMAPAGGFVQVDVDPAAFGMGYPEAPVMPVLGDVGEALRAILARWPADGARDSQPIPRPHPEMPEPDGDGRVRPDALMGVVQRLIVDGTDAVVLAESGNSFTWATHHLRFDAPGRYRVSTNVGSMGHAATGVVGAALARQGGAVAILGDGAMLMANEISTAVKANARALWIVLNDGRYNMCHQGMQALGMEGLADAGFPAVDFAAMARAQGAHGVRVSSEAELEAAISMGLDAAGPFVVDVLIDADRPAPAQGRNEGLAKGGAKGSPKRERDGKPLSFPLTAAE